MKLLAFLLLVQAGNVQAWYRAYVNCGSSAGTIAGNITWEPDAGYVEASSIALAATQTTDSTILPTSVASFQRRGNVSLGDDLLIGDYEVLLYFVPFDSQLMTTHSTTINFWVGSAKIASTTTVANREHILKQMVTLKKAARITIEVYSGAGEQRWIMLGLPCKHV